MTNIIEQAVNQDDLHVYITLRPAIIFILATLSFICIYVLCKRMMEFVHGIGSISSVIVLSMCTVLCLFYVIVVGTSDDIKSVLLKTAWVIFITISIGILAISVKLLLKHSDTIKKYFLRNRCNKRIENYNYRSVDFSTVVELLDDILFSHSLQSNTDFVPNIEKMKSAYTQYTEFCANINDLFANNNYPFTKSISKQIEEMTEGLNNKISPPVFQICRILNDEQYKGTTANTTASIIQTITENVITTIHKYTAACEELYTAAQNTIDDITTSALRKEYTIDMDTSTSELDQTIFNIQKLISIET